MKSISKTVIAILTTVVIGSVNLYADFESGNYNDGDNQPDGFRARRLERKIDREERKVDRIDRRRDGGRFEQQQNQQFQQNPQGQQSQQKGQAVQNNQNQVQNQAQNYNVTAPQVSNEQNLTPRQENANIKEEIQQQLQTQQQGSEVIIKL